MIMTWLPLPDLSAGGLSDEFRFRRFFWFFKNAVVPAADDEPLVNRPYHLEPHSRSTLPAPGKALSRKQGGLVHQTVIIVMDTVDAAAGHLVPRNISHFHAGCSRSGQIHRVL